jgi:uncharacterized protein YueI
MSYQLNGGNYTFLPTFRQRVISNYSENKSVMNKTQEVSVRMQKLNSYEKIFVRLSCHCSLIGT